jgi:hypothetical protein
MTHDLRQRVSNAAPTPTFSASNIRDRARHRMLQRRISSGVVGLAVAMSGFGGLLIAFNSEVSRPTRPAAQVDGTIRQAYLPITDALQWTVDEQRTMHEAQFLLVSRCMQREGFDHPYVKFAPFLLNRRYGLTDADAASRWGYGLPPGLGRNDSAGEAYFDSLSPAKQRAYEIAIVGQPDGQVPIGSDGDTMAAGCIGEARDTIYGSTARAIRTEELRKMFGELQAEAYAASEDDQRVQLVKDQWMDCMDRHGFDVSGLDDPLEASILVTAPVGGPADIDLAMTVVRCNDATDLVEIWSGADAENQEALLEAQPGEAEELTSLREEALANAARTVREESRS